MQDWFNNLAGIVAKLIIRQKALVEGLERRVDCVKVLGGPTLNPYYLEQLKSNDNFGGLVESLPEKYLSVSLFETIP